PYIVRRHGGHREKLVIHQRPDVRAGRDGPTRAVPMLHQRLSYAEIVDVVSYSPDVIGCDGVYRSEEVVVRPGAGAWYLRPPSSCPVVNQGSGYRLIIVVLDA